MTEMVYRSSQDGVTMQALVRHHGTATNTWKIRVFPPGSPFDAKVGDRFYSVQFSLLRTNPRPGGLGPDKLIYWTPPRDFEVTEVFDVDDEKRILTLKPIAESNADHRDTA